MPFIFKLLHCRYAGCAFGERIDHHGSVIPTKGAIIPAAVRRGYRLLWNERAARHQLNGGRSAGKSGELRNAIEPLVPHGRTTGRGRRDVGAWEAPARQR